MDSLGLYHPHHLLSQARRPSLRRVVMLTLLSLTRLSPHVVPIGDEVVVSGALAPVPGAPFTKEICDFLATLDLLNLDLAR